MSTRFLTTPDPDPLAIALYRRLLPPGEPVPVKKVVDSALQAGFDRVQMLLAWRSLGVTLRQLQGPNGALEMHYLLPVEELHANTVGNKVE